ncbi:ethanolamine-phosphate cytidylyltransferase, putative [Theileria equi strain WA]|uniref:ethanolamine-phosphate cytidylyltransferase n=1 Tax=Theileria equi strain WA TaxID=1537102 RepID=L0AZQ7_THEEQ|nr:ethanolamine-phosphate cytidylyltransferase, putative [Theileria equi strain WA]AFZ81050.1 ethanolamine-phosphate cytidylyltransferase, putative [Theileria equi strain WA]|eukprot:XP_004830716.1 ethanolamine-phosphate cytidylyltransferase, putative [Theileria equi strain WA]
MVGPEQLRDSRIYVDGVFDLIHWGHLNALRQSHELGGKVVVGVVSDEETNRAKGIYPIYSQEERAELVKGCKWVDDAIVGTPYDVSLNFLHNVAKCDVVAHGDDIAIGSSGKDCYEEPKNAGKFVYFKRSCGVSTSTTLFRLIEALESERFSHLGELERGISVDFEQCLRRNEEEMINEGFLEEDNETKRTIRYPRCCMSANLFGKFIPNIPRPPNGRIVYVDGSFDVFHNGHLRLLEKAKAMGDYLVVGIYDDQTVRTLKGSPFPFTNLLDRALIVSAMKYTDDLILGAPYIITRSFIKTMGITLVVAGTSDDNSLIRKKLNPHKDPKELGIMHYIDSGSSTTSMDIIKRVSKRMKHIRENISNRYKREKMNGTH